MKQPIDAIEDETNILNPKQKQLMFGGPSSDFDPNTSFNNTQELTNWLSLYGSNISSAPEQYMMTRPDIVKLPDPVILSDRNFKPNTENKEAFLNDAYLAARAASNNKGLFPEVMAAIAANESRYGKSGLNKKQNNYFGIRQFKGTPQQYRSEVDWATDEYNQEGVKYTDPSAKFEKHPSFVGSMEALIDFLSRNPRYEQVFKASDPYEQLELLKKAGYRTGGWKNEEKILRKHFKMPKKLNQSGQEELMFGGLAAGLANSLGANETITNIAGLAGSGLGMLVNPMSGLQGVKYAGNLINEGMGNSKASFAMGGNIQKFTGPSHEQGGITLNSQVEVEGGEIMTPNKIVLSDRLGPKGKKGPTYAQLGDKIRKRLEGRKGDKLTEESVNREIAALEQLQESDPNILKAREKLNKNNNIQYAAYGLDTDPPRTDSLPSGTIPQHMIDALNNSISGYDAAANAIATGTSYRTPTDTTIVPPVTDPTTSAVQSTNVSNSPATNAAPPEKPKSTTNGSFKPSMSYNPNGMSFPMQSLQALMSGDPSRASNVMESYFNTLPPDKKAEIEMYLEKQAMLSSERERSIQHTQEDYELQKSLRENPMTRMLADDSGYMLQNPNSVRGYNSLIHGLLNSVHPYADNNYDNAWDNLQTSSQNPPTNPPTNPPQDTSEFINAQQRYEQGVASGDLFRDGTKAIAPDNYNNYSNKNFNTPTQSIVNSKDYTYRNSDDASIQAKLRELGRMPTNVDSPPSTDQSQEKTITEQSFDATSVKPNPWGYAAQAVGPLAQLGYAALTPAQNTQFDRVNPTLMNLDPARIAMERQGALANANARRMNAGARTMGANMAANTASNVGISRGVQDGMLQSYLQENTYNTNARNQANQFNAQVQMQERIANEQNQAARRSMIFNSIGNLGTGLAAGVSENTAMKAQDLMNQRALNMANSMFGNYTIDANGNITFRS